MSLKRKIEDAEEVVGDLIKGVPLEALVRLPGLLVVQYLFFWNWKRIVDPNSREVIVAGAVVWLMGIGMIVLMFLSWA